MGQSGNKSATGGRRGVDSCESQLRAREEGGSAARKAQGWGRRERERLRREGRREGQRKNGGVAVGQHERNKSAMGGRRGVDSCEASSEHGSAARTTTAQGWGRREARRWLREGSDRKNGGVSFRVVTR